MDPNRGHINEGYVTDAPCNLEGRSLQSQPVNQQVPSAPGVYSHEQQQAYTPPVYTLSYPTPPGGIVQPIPYPQGPPPPYFLPPNAPQSHIPMGNIPLHPPPPYFSLPHVHQTPLHRPPVQTLPNSHQAPLSERPIITRRFYMNFSLRLAFLRKVYIFYLVQSLILHGFLCIFLYSPDVRSYFTMRYEYTIAAIVGEIILVAMLAIFPKLRYSEPINYTLLMCDIMLSFLIGVAAASTNGNEVLLTSTINIVTTAGLFINAGNEKYFGGYISCLIVFTPTLVSCIAYYLAYSYELIHIIIAGISALIISLIIFCDMLQMLAGTHRCYPVTDESVCLSIMLLQKSLFSLCLLACVLMIFVKKLYKWLYQQNACKYLV